VAKISSIVLVVVAMASCAGFVRGQDSRPAAGRSLSTRCEPETRATSTRALNPNSRYAIAWATYLGCPARDWLTKIVMLPDGSLVVGGYTTAEGMPTTPGVVQPKFSPPENPDAVMAGDFYLAHLTPSGGLLAATYLGGANMEYQLGLGVDRQGNVIVGGETGSPDFPVTKDAAQTTFGGQVDLVAAKLTPDLTKVLWATFLGGPDRDGSWNGTFLVAPDDGVILFGLGRSSFPQADEDVNLGSRDPDDVGDVCVAKLLADGSRVVFSSRFGGSGQDQVTGAALMADGSILLSGFTVARDFPFPEKTTRFGPRGQGPVNGGDAFVAQLRADGRKLLAMTVFGGSSDDWPHRPIIADDGSVIVGGSTESWDFPTTPQALQRTFGGVSDGFVATLSEPGGELKYATLVGGACFDPAGPPKLGPDGAVWFATSVDDPSYPVTGDALHFYAGGESDGVLAALAPGGSKLEFRTFLGGEGRDIISDFAFGPAGEIYVVGSTTSNDLPTTAASPQPKPAGRQDGFVMKLVPRPNGVESRPVIR
jgi:hypothetical protein